MRKISDNQDDSTVCQTFNASGQKTLKLTMDIFDKIGKEIAELSKSTIKIYIDLNQKEFLLFVEKPTLLEDKETAIYKLTNAHIAFKYLFSMQNNIEHLSENLSKGLETLLQKIAALYANHVNACDAVKPFYETLLTLSKSLEALKNNLIQYLISTIDFTPLLTYAKEYNNQASTAFKSAEKALDAASDPMPLLLTTSFTKRVLALVNDVTDQKNSIPNQYTTDLEKTLKNITAVYTQKLNALLTAYKEKEFAQAPKDPDSMQTIPDIVLIDIFLFVFSYDIKNALSISKNTNIAPQHKKWFSSILSLSLVNKNFLAIISSDYFKKMACRLLPNYNELLLMNERLSSEPKSNLIDSIAKKINPVYIFGIPMLLLMAAEWKVNGVQNSVLEWLPKLTPSLLGTSDNIKNEPNIDNVDTFRFGNLFAKYIFDNAYIAFYLEKWTCANTLSSDAVLTSLLFRKKLLSFEPNTAVLTMLCNTIYKESPQTLMPTTTLITGTPTIIEEKDYTLFQLKLLILQAYYYYTATTQPPDQHRLQHKLFYELMYECEVTIKVSSQPELSILELAKDVTVNPNKSSFTFFNTFVAALEDGTLEELVFADNDAKSLKN